MIPIDKAQAIECEDMAVPTAQDVTVDVAGESEGCNERDREERSS